MAVLAGFGVTHDNFSQAAGAALALYNILAGLVVLSTSAIILSYRTAEKNLPSYDE